MARLIINLLIWIIEPLLVVTKKKTIGIYFEMIDWSKSTGHIHIWRTYTGTLMLKQILKHVVYLVQRIFSSIWKNIFTGSKELQNTYYKSISDYNSLDVFESSDTGRHFLMVVYLKYICNSQNPFYQIQMLRHMWCQKQLNWLSWHQLFR